MAILTKDDVRSRTPAAGAIPGAYTHPHNGHAESVAYRGDRVLTGWIEADGERTVTTTLAVFAPDEESAKAAAKGLAAAIRAAIGKTDYDLSVLRNPRLRAAHPELAAPWARSVAAAKAWLADLEARGWDVYAETI